MCETHAGPSQGFPASSAATSGVIDENITPASSNEALPEMSNESLQPWLQKLGLRFFMPKEIANMHSFPCSFRFPSKVKLRKQYALIGNSVSAAVVGGLLEYLLMDVKKSCSYLE